VGARYTAFFQNDPVANSSSYTMNTESFPRVKRPGRGVNHPAPSTAEFKEIIELYFYTPSLPT